MKTRCVVAFRDARFSPVVLPAGAVLSQHLTVENSPVLFGCRTGICATCISRVEGDVPRPGADEQEILDMMAPDEPAARLICQIELLADICIEPISGD